MTEREITIIDRLNRLGVDNTMWGVVRNDGWLTNELHGTDQHVTVPAHIYVHREDPKRASSRSVLLISGLPSCSGAITFAVT